MARNSNKIVTRVRPALVLFALLSALLTGLLFLAGPITSDAPYNLQSDRSRVSSVEETRDVTPETSAAVTPQLTLPVDGPLAAGTQPAAGVDELPVSCVNAAIAGFKFAEGVELDQGMCQAAAGLVSGPLVPAVPGFPGFNVPDTGDPFRRRLIDETDSPDWSRPMEGRIYGEVGVLVDFPVVTLHASCKAATCGVLIAYSNSAHSGGDYNAFAQRLADTLGFTGYYGGFAVRPEISTGFTYVYLGDWITERPDPDVPPRILPASFEEFRESLSGESDGASSD